MTTDMLSKMMPLSGKIAYKQTEMLRHTIMLHKSCKLRHCALTKKSTQTPSVYSEVHNSSEKTICVICSQALHLSNA